MKEDVDDRKMNPDAFCPSCERFIGPVDVCPYCDCDSARKPVFKFMIHGSVLLAILGLFFLHLMAVHSEVPVIRISEITPMMNFGLVRIKGVVEKDAFIRKKKGQADSVSFPVNDGTGQLRVVAYDQVARKLVNADLVPKGKASVELTGSLNVSADGNSRLVLRSVDELRVMGNVKPGKTNNEY